MIIIFHYHVSNEITLGDFTYFFEKYFGISETCCNFYYQNKISNRSWIVNLMYTHDGMTLLITKLTNRNSFGSHLKRNIVLNKSAYLYHSKFDLNEFF